ncbi:hypothetical protein PTI98_006775 [Pleurotus ostreatus]|nr:hypothetical protein PTI98_006775 [Pleurotus ostreatus]
MGALFNTLGLTEVRVPQYREKLIDVSAVIPGTLCSVGANLSGGKVAIYHSKISMICGEVNGTLQDVSNVMSNASQSPKSRLNSTYPPPDPALSSAPRTSIPGRPSFTILSTTYSSSSSTITGGGYTRRRLGKVSTSFNQARFSKEERRVDVAVGQIERVNG